ncbi:efflux RND transporter permease subunit [Coxiella burnetii]|uniref:efflux RND transporter permease subunit n=1 Tax=Coxiella burnetii TaxID=777 RepID=UPI00051F1AD8|nr:efflux RND transporter permease subunit [Coxiella burnetii]AIT63232.1 Multidrug efflux protein [Coxiella burnetii str. Namibia]
MASSKFTDKFIIRPVLAIVVSLFIFILGLRAITEMEVRQYPKMNNTLITISTAYPGAPASLIEGFITTRLEKSIAGAEGIDYMTSTSTQGVSTINVFIKLNFDPNVAFTDIMSKVAQVQNDLPRESQLPVIQKLTGTQTALMYISFSSDQMSSEQISDYLNRVVQPKIETVFGVSQAEILGGQTFAMRVWLNTKRMAALNVTPTDVTQALINNNFQSAAGQTKGDFITLYIKAKTDIGDKQAFENLVIKEVNGTLIRIRDIGRVELGAEDYDSSVYMNGKSAIFVAVNTTPTANPLSVIANVKKILPDLEKEYPPSLHSKVVYDATEYIQASIYEVIRTIFEATLIVIVVIFLFLGSIRTVVIPVITIPLSLIGVCFLMWFLGYSLNLLTLLSMVLAIGLVVDDAIVVVENVYRHIEEGMDGFHAAIRGAREIAFPIISMTLTLAAVYAPIGFMTGLTGALFTEFAFTLAGAVIVSGIIALTLSPMMCSKFLNQNIGKQRYVQFIDRSFERLKQFYSRRLHGVLNHRFLMVLLAVAVLASCFIFYMNTTSELAPEEDQGALFVQAQAPQYANIDYVEAYSKQYGKYFKKLPSMANYFMINGFGTVNTVLAAMIMKPWDQRQQSQKQAQAILQPELNTVAGLQTVVFPLASLPGGGTGLPVQFVITSIAPFNKIYLATEQIVEEAKRSGLFIFVDSELKYNNPQLNVIIDRNKAGDLGVTMQSLSQILAYSLGGNYINRFAMMGQSYKVIPQLSRLFRLNPSNLEQIYVNTAGGQLIPLSTLVKMNITTQPNLLSHFQQLNSAQIDAVLAPGHTMGEALTYLEQTANKVLARDMSYDFGGQMRQFVQEGQALVVTFFLAIIIIYLVLAAQFESFRDPFVILISVPMSICGALIFLNLGLATINIYTQIGLVTLIGLISKHGILMVEFANKLQEEEGLSVREAIEKSAAIRLRPILMTTAAMVLGVVPLILATGAGAVSRFDIGLVIATGMLIGTMFTLFVVPTMYLLIAKKHQPLRKVDE